MCGTRRDHLGRTASRRLVVVYIDPESGVAPLHAGNRRPRNRLGRRIGMAGRTMAALTGAVLAALGVPSISDARPVPGANGARLVCSGNPSQIHSFSLTIPADQQTTGLHDGHGTV